MTKDLYQALAEVQAEHFPEYISQSCLCGRTVENVAVWADHIAQVVGDMIIDLAGTGQLLASIDRIAR